MFLNCFHLELSAVFQKVWLLKIRLFFNHFLLFHKRDMVTLKGKKNVCFFFNLAVTMDE